MKQSPKSTIVVHMDLEMTQQIEDFQFLNRLPNRSAAVRALIEKALASGEPK
jgi:metal-responsive CopG/Arc/MetJ family transcriptional regulator